MDIQSPELPPQIDYGASGRQIVRPVTYSARQYRARSEPIEEGVADAEPSHGHGHRREIDGRIIQPALEQLSERTIRRFNGAEPQDRKRKHQNKIR